MKSLIVQISGQQGSGKTTLAASLKKKLEEGNIYVGEYSYAKVLYEMHDSVLKILSGFRTDLPRKDGRLLQLLGTEWGRKTYGDDIWINIVLTQIRMCNSVMAGSYRIQDGIKVPLYPIAVHMITDCRFPNEAGIPSAVFRLDCPEEVRRERILATPGQCWREGYHESEHALDDYKHFTNRFDSSKFTVDQLTNFVVGDIMYCLGSEINVEEV